MGQSPQSRSSGATAKPVPWQLWHRDHISSIQKTFFTIFNKWLPESGYKAGEGPELEVYDNRFDPRTGNGGLDIRISIRK